MTVFPKRRWLIYLTSHNRKRLYSEENTLMKQHTYLHKGIFQFEDGAELTGIQVTYHTSEKSWQAGDERKVIWICHALTANSDAEDWWPDLVGPGKLIDTEKYFVVCVNMLGSPYGTSGPASICSETGSPWYFNFPSITIRDIIHATILIREELGIPQIDLLIGSSVGGFQAIEWAITEPDIIKHAIFMACACRVSPWLTATNESQRMALEADPSFRACRNLNGGKAGLECARSIGLLCYRTFEGYQLTQEEKEEDTLHADRAASYQRYQGKKFVDRFDAYSYYYLANSLDTHNVGRHRGGVKNALERIQADCTVIAIDSDRLFPTHELKFIASCLHHASYHEIHSEFGHDGFLKENSQLEKIIGPILTNL